MMGMYDIFYIDLEKLPLDQDTKERLKNLEKLEWQTKSLDCTLTEIFVTEKGQLTQNMYNYEWDENAPSFFGTNGRIIQTELGLKELNYTGSIRFCGPGTREDFFQFDAVFVKGQLIKVLQYTDK